MSSFSDSRADKVVNNFPGEWVNHNARHISRIYPAGKRVDSSNYDPNKGWNVGSQIVALNYQTPGTPMHLNDGKFRDNGGCGYLLKHPWLCDSRLRRMRKFNPATGPFPPGRTELTLEV
ncbi:unnamed protein product, partial [Discosporangium mesarthrocarpum]